MTPFGSRESSSQSIADLEMLSKGMPHADDGDTVVNSENVQEAVVAVAIVYWPRT
eukprot:SAG31_NODE_4765_length_2970_cov_21.015640_5_plen_55_part_00